MNNPVYEAQLNRHEEKISEISGRLHSYDLGLKWCEAQIKRLAGDNYSPVVVMNDDEDLKKKIKESINSMYGYDRICPIEKELNKEYDKLKNDHNLLKEAYVALDDRYHREKETWTDKYNELQNSIALKNRRIAALENGAKSRNDVIDHLRLEIKELKDSNDMKKRSIDAFYADVAQKTSEVNKLKKDVEAWKDAFLRSQVDVNNYVAVYSDTKKELDKYSWRRVDNTEPLPFEDHELYLFVVDGYPTPVKGKYHSDSLSHISIIVDDGDGKGPQYKVVFFMDGVIRYWMPLPEMPDTAIK